MRTFALILLALPAFAANQVALSWTAAAQNPTGTAYNIYRAPGSCGTANQTFIKLNATPIAALTYNDASVTNGGSYCYYSTATFGGQESLPSIKAGTSIPLDPPPTFTLQLNIAATITINGQQLAAADKTIMLSIPAGAQ
jgi:hypothetical protein